MAAVPACGAVSTARPRAVSFQATLHPGLA